MTRRRIRYSDKDNSDIILRIVCAIVFCLTSFLYLFVYQQDVMAYRFARLFGVTAYYSPLVFSVLAVMLCLAVHTLCLPLFRHCKMFYAVAFFPSLAILWLLTEFDMARCAAWTMLLALVLLPLLLVFLSARHDFFLWSITHVRTFSRRLWVNVMTLTFAFILVSCLSGYDNVVRFRLKAERMIASGEYGKALGVGYRSADTDRSMTMLRVYALSIQGKLGDSLFRYPVTGGSSALLPDGNNVRCLLLNDADICRYVGVGNAGSDGFSVLRNLFSGENGCSSPVRDYILCGYLLDKKLDSFVKSLLKCGIKDFSSLPRHYREALILYCHTHSGHVITYKNATMDADYMDMRALGMKYMLSPDERRASVKDTYGNTYWYYYYYVN